MHYMTLYFQCEATDFSGVTKTCLVERVRKSLKSWQLHVWLFSINILQRLFFLCMVTTLNTCVHCTTAEASYWNRRGKGSARPPWFCRDSRAGHWRRGILHLQEAVSQIALQTSHKRKLTFLLGLKNSRSVLGCTMSAINPQVLFCCNCVGISKYIFEKRMCVKGKLLTQLTCWRLNDICH